MVDCGRFLASLLGMGNGGESCGTRLRGEWRGVERWGEKCNARVTLLGLFVFRGSRSAVFRSGEEVVGFVW